jgi:thioredoxin reductase (NADPH)
VVGGGDTAIEEALFLSKLVNSVMVIHRKNKLKASVIMQQKALNDKISFLWNSIVTEVVGSGQVEGIRVKDTLSGDTLDIKTDAIFVAIGHKPNTEISMDSLNLMKSRILESMMAAKLISKGFLSPVTYMTISTDKQ